MNAVRSVDYAQELADSLGPPVKKKRRGMTSRQIARIEEETATMRLTRDWSTARPGHLVALWAWCHLQVYGVKPEEMLSPGNFAKACMRAGQCVKASFNGTCAYAVDFIRWVWTREKRRISKENADRGRRIGWALQFHASLVSDWRVATVGQK